MYRCFAGSKVARSRATCGSGPLSVLELDLVFHDGHDEDVAGSLGIRVFDLLMLAFTESGLLERAASDA